MILRTISATSVKMYDTCPLQWKFKYKINFLQMPNPNFLVGTAFHSGAEMFHNGRTLEHIITVLKDEMLNGSNTTSSELERFAQARQLVEAYVRNPVNYPTIKTEHKFSIPIFGITAPLFGFVDRLVEGGVVEYKTSAKDYTRDDIENIQTDIYSYAYRHLYRTMPRVTYCVLNKTKAKRPDYKPQILEIVREEQHMEELVKKLREFEDNVKADRFAPTPGFHCRWCPFADNCEYQKYGN